MESIFYGILAIALVFAVCAIGQKLSNTFTDIVDVTCQLDWYLYPMKIQRSLIPILTYVQKPVVIEFFGSFSCSAEQFKKVKFKDFLANPKNLHSYSAMKSLQFRIKFQFNGTFSLIC